MRDAVPAVRAPPGPWDAEAFLAVTPRAATKACRCARKHGARLGRSGRPGQILYPPHARDIGGAGRNFRDAFARAWRVDAGKYGDAARRVSDARTGD